MSAAFSPCRTYRYSLTRWWAGSARVPGIDVMFIGLNPSTADETNDDPTIRRCIGFAKSWGFSGLVMTNLFALRATDPKEMKRAADPVGSENDETLMKLSACCGLVVAAWGAHGEHLGRAAAVRSMIPRLHYLKLTKDGHPSHPLYLKGDLTPQLWMPPAALQSHQSTGEGKV